ncbi:hypothetical protein MNBD_GAMMA19-2154 [hydrothermal vent metagenome]|uniref:Uncharacterized protein n=1 Tax=hydrothermal vent metagenome TaxID=652676 RepID=A0A3B1A0M5_9ZZZZ
MRSLRLRVFALDFIIQPGRVEQAQRFHQTGKEYIQGLVCYQCSPWVVVQGFDFFVSGCEYRGDYLFLYGNKSCLLVEPLRLFHPTGLRFSG